MIYNEILTDVKEKFKNHPKRLKHILAVVKEAKKLAKHYNYNLDSAMIAALFHDYTKYDCLEKQLSFLDKAEITKYEEFPFFYHGLSASRVLKQKYQINNLDILHAISCHTWGALEMNLLDKIILISDKIEKNRNYPEVKRLRKLAYQDLNLACIEFLISSIEYTKSKEHKIHEEQYQIIDYLKGEKNDKN